jgi:hypothetical protein
MMHCREVRRAMVVPGSCSRGTGGRTAQRNRSTCLFFIFLRFFYQLRFGTVIFYRDTMIGAVVASSKDFDVN